MFETTFKLLILMSTVSILLEVASVEQLTIKSSASFNYHVNYKPANAHDGDYNTLYSVKDDAVDGNFLKLYLYHAYSIGEVKMVSRSDNMFTIRMVNTEVRVYSTTSGEIEVVSCGKITEQNHPGDRDFQKSMEGRTFILDCNGVVGDMLYLTDLDYSDSHGHNIAEVEIYGRENLLIDKSEAKSWYHQNTTNEPLKYAPDKAYDGNYKTFYDAENSENKAGNFLKLYLSQKYKIGTVKLTNREKRCCHRRIVGTEVMVYLVEELAGGVKETKIANCGERISDYDDSVTYQTFSLDCKGAAGNMIYITDKERQAHSISEVHIQGEGAAASCTPLLLKRGRTGSLPVKTNRNVTWDTVTWTVVDKSGGELHKYSCHQPECKVDEMFRIKSEIPGVHKYSVEIKMRGETLKCDSVLLNYGLLIKKYSRLYVKHNGTKISAVEAFTFIESTIKDELYLQKQGAIWR